MLPQAVDSKKATTSSGSGKNLLRLTNNGRLLLNPYSAERKKLDAMLFSSSSHLLYLTSYAGFSATERDAFLLVTNNKGHLFTHSLLALELKEKFKQLTVIEHKRDHPFAKNLAEVVSKNKLKK